MSNYSSRSVTLALLFLFIALCGSASVTTGFHSVYFQTDSFSLSNDARQQLSDLVKKLPATGEIEILIAGYTDAEGTGDYNRTLSEKRASSVTAELVTLGVEHGIVSSNYFGESKPVTTNRSEQGRAKNRRVEIMVKHTVINSIHDIVSADPSLAPQQFEISTASGQTIKGKKGIEISIPADAFTDLSGNEIKSDKAVVTMTEFTGTADAFFHGITTMSDKGLLQSGGMFRLDASADGKPLQLKDGKVMEVKIPVTNPESGMKVYLSKTDTEGKIVWVETDAAFKPSAEPVDKRTIQLARDKYSIFLSTGVAIPGRESIAAVSSFATKKPQQPVRPILRLQEERNLKNSGLKSVSTNRKVQQRMLEKMNTQIQVNNEKRKAKHKKRMVEYLADSASYPERQKSYLKSKMDYMDYATATRQQLDTLMETYREGVLKKRLFYYLKQVLAASENGVLYNTDLVQRCKSFCTGENNLFRDFAFESAMTNTYTKLNTPVEGKVRYVGHYYFLFGINAYAAYANVLLQPDVNRVMNQLVDDNPYLTAEQRKVQKANISAGSVAAMYSRPTAVNSYYTATVGQLGYVNCDRLYKIESVIALDVTNLKKGAESVAFIKGANASQNISSGSNKFGKNEEVRLLSVYFENGRPLVAFQEVKLDSPQKVELQYKEMKTEEFKMLVLSFI